MKDPKKWLHALNYYVSRKISKYQIDPGSYFIDFKMYGYDAVTPVIHPDFVPEEIGLVMIVTAKTQELATRIARIYNPYLLHFPAKPDGQLPSLALLFSPAEIEKGPAYQFRLNHSVKVNDPLELFHIKMEVTA